MGASVSFYRHRRDSYSYKEQEHQSPVPFFYAYKQKDWKTKKGLGNMDYQVMPSLNADEYKELKEDIAQRGVMVPIEFDEHGNILDGHHRLQICNELGIKDYPKVIRAGMTEEEKRTHARKLNMARRHLTQEQRRELICQQLRETPEKSDRQIAAGLGVSHVTVAARRNELERTGQIDQLKTNIGADGKERPRQVQRKPIFIFNPSEQEERALQNPDMLERIVDNQSIIETHKPHVANNSGNNEWYTPKEYIEAARKVMGTIDLDPASCEIANKIVQAKTFYTAEDNGLLNPWFGNVWLNPPYSADLIGKFAEKAAKKEYKQAIILVNNATETAWFNTLIQVASAVVFPSSRVKFYMPDGKTGAPLQGQAVIYIGSNSKSFMEIYSPFGWGAFI